VIGYLTEQNNNYINSASPFPSPSMEDQQQSLATTTLLPTPPNGVFFSKEESLEMKLVFRMKRPRSHFIGSKPGLGRLKTASTARKTKTPPPPKYFLGSKRVADVDNLAKFVLDSLNEVLYIDDCQIASLTAIKVYDDDEERECEGSTTVWIRGMDDEYIEKQLLLL